jgi:hypothetical protein
MHSKHGQFQLRPNALAHWVAGQPSSAALRRLAIIDTRNR